jgi:hypothetical protein
MRVSRGLIVSAAIVALEAVTIVLYSTRGERLARAADGAGMKPLVEFTTDGKLKQPSFLRSM